MLQNNIEIKELLFDNSTFLPEIVKLLEEGHTVTLRLRGFSMRPFLEDNRDKALLKKPDSINVGDAVLAEILPQHFVLHRIINIDKEEITLRGDGNLNIEKCKLSDIKGMVLGFYRKGRNTLDNTNGTKWKLYSFIWIHLFPIRRYILGAYRKIWLRFLKPI